MQSVDSLIKASSEGMVKVRRVLLRTAASEVEVSDKNPQVSDEGRDLS